MGARCTAGGAARPGTRAEAAKQDQLRARHRLGKYLLRHGKRPPQQMRAWTENYLQWIKCKVSFDQRSQQVTLEDYLNEVDHAGARVARLEKAIDEAVEQAPENMRELIQALQALRGVAKVGAVTIVAEVGILTRLEHPRQLMGYSGAVSSEQAEGAPDGSRLCRRAERLEPRISEWSTVVERRFDLCSKCPIQEGENRKEN